MKKMLFLLLFLFLEAVQFQAVAEEPYFCAARGSVLKYERRYVSDGSLKWRHQMSIKSVVEGKDGERHVSYESYFTKSGGAAMYGGPVALKADILQDGTVMIDISESMASVFRNIFPDAAKVVADGGSSRLPTSLKTGDVLPDASCVVSVSGLKYTTTVTDRRVIAEEDLDTPAGRFHCAVVSEHKVERGPGRNRVTTAHTWYARGIGMVRHDTYDRNMKLETSEVLSFRYLCPVKEK